MFSLTPSALITMFEIDISEIAFDNGIALSDSDKIFRFHNNIKLINTNIFWQGNEYIAAPVHAEGFIINSKGVLPTPKLAMTVNDGGIVLLASLKDKIRELNDLVGAKVTRIRTFAKYLDAINFSQSDTPPGFNPDPYAEFPRDVYFIDRKSLENKLSVEFELASLLDIEGIQLPGRLVIANRCVWSYRGEGCLYAGSPVADFNSQKILDMLKIVSLNPRGLWDRNSNYNIGDAIFIERDNIQYWFVSRSNGNTIQPPNPSFWIADECSKLASGCRLRFTGILPFGGFQAANRLN